MNETQIKGYLVWLGNALTAQRNNISQILLRLRGISAYAHNNFSLHQKFMNLMVQVAHDREKELDILHEIETVEQRHSNMKKLNLLRHANDSVPPADVKQPLAEEMEEKPKRFNLMALLGLFYLLSPSRNSQKKQDLR